MKKSISGLLIVVHLLLLIGQSFGSQSENPMKVQKIIDNVLSANKGSVDGVASDQKYLIMRMQGSDIIEIGSAKVVYVKEDISALNITRLKTGYSVEIGDLLFIDTDYDQAEQVIEQAISEAQGQGQTADKTNYYSKGRETAREDYDSGGPLVGGLLAGFGLGFIGWGVGYLIVANKGVNVPESYTQDLGQQDKQDFNNGYTDQVKSKRRNFFNTGAIIGTIGAVIFIASTQGDDK